MKVGRRLILKQRHSVAPTSMGGTEISIHEQRRYTQATTIVLSAILAIPQEDANTSLTQQNWEFQKRSMISVEHMYMHGK